jgi:hypothetical protein
VAVVLDLRNLQSANWEYGIWHATETEDYQVFVTPPIKGWVLAVGVPLLFEADDSQGKRILPLSNEFSDAQFFASMRISSAYLWARALNDKLIRLFYEGDGARHVEGEETPEEKILAFRFFDYSAPESQLPEYWQRKDLTFVDEDCVLKVAEKWSLNPTKLDQMGLESQLRILGNPATSYPPRPKPIRR